VAGVEKFRREDWVLGGLGLVLAFDLLQFAWFSLPSASVTFRGTTLAFGGGSLTATDTPDGWLGLLAVIALLALVTDLALERLSPETQVPVIGGNRANTRVVLASAAVGFMGLKFLLHLGTFSNLGFGFWFGVLLSGVLVYYTIQARDAEAVLRSQPTAPSAPAGPAGTAGPPTG
jgi:hypothetical protein